MYTESKENKKEYFFSLTYRELEAVTRISYASWGRWFTGGNSPTLDHLEKMALALNIPLSEFIEIFKERRDKTMAANATKKVAA